MRGGLCRCEEKDCFENRCEADDKTKGKHFISECKEHNYVVTRILSRYLQWS